MKAAASLRRENNHGPIQKGEAGLQRQRQRSVAKIGMTLSMGALVATGLMRGRGARTLHVWSGVALIGFSVWHHALYRPVPSGRDGSS